MIKRKEKVYSTGLMVESMTETGSMESNMGLDYTLLPQVKQNRESGMKGKESSG